MLFGSSRKAFGTSNIMPGNQPGVPQMPTQVIDPGVAPAETRGKVNWGGVLADALAGAAGKEGPYLASLQLAQKRRMALAEDQRKRSLDFADFQKQYDYEVQHPKASTAQPYRWEDNAGNVWERGMDGSNQRIFTDVVPKYYVQGDQAVQIPNPYGGGGSGTPSGPVGKLTPLGGGASNGVGGFRR